MITLYLDMDGVLCNFEKSYHALPDVVAGEFDRKKFRSAVIDHKIFETLEPMPDARELLNHVSRLHGVKIEILTSMGTHDPFQGEQARGQKMRWLEKHNIPYRSNFVRSKEEKAKYATPTSILIDDSVGCVKPFIAKGGHAILHTSAKKTISELDSLILQLNAIK